MTPVSYYISLYNSEPIQWPNDIAQEMANSVITKKKKVFVADFLNNHKKKTILESNLRIIGTTTK